MSSLPQRTGRRNDELRPVQLERGVAPYAEGSCLITAGLTRVLCTATVQEILPEWRRGQGAGWVTAEYGMLPRATHRRTPRERGQAGGRTSEIQRLIGRALRASMDLATLGERTITMDCDVLGADGGTRTAAITGGAVALHDACSWLVAQGSLSRSPMRQLVAAVSVGVVGGEIRLDLDYLEDSGAQVDMNVVALGQGDLVEIQGTAEHHSFSRAELDVLLDLALSGIGQLIALQRQALQG
ncbi:MAG: ribonuclease PH [Gemmatimonadetes bacterium]|nr:ribonuclease PH [Gemmatimonadota bacterium]